MKDRFLDDLNWELEKIVDKHMDTNPYANVDYVREMVSQNFADWLVSKFKEEYYE